MLHLRTMLNLRIQGLMDMQRRNVKSLGTKQTHRTKHQIVLGSTLDGNARHGQAVLLSLFRTDFIRQGDGVEDGLQVVVAVWAALCNEQSQIDLAAGFECKHLCSVVWGYYPTKLNDNVTSGKADIQNLHDRQNKAQRNARMCGKLRIFA